MSKTLTPQTTLTNHPVPRMLPSMPTVAASPLKWSRTQVSRHQAHLLLINSYAGTAKPQRKGITSSPPLISLLIYLGTAGSTLSQAQRIGASFAYRMTSETKARNQKTSQVGNVYSGAQSVHTKQETDVHREK